jgi:cellulose synthase/poly-beta-1,6-N-acetylglucosamine synthase-like glycosyltransferase
MWTAGQACLYLAAAAGLAGWAWVCPQAVPVWGGALLLAAYGLVVLLRTTAVLSGLILHDLERGAGDPDDTAWPVYTVLLPVYREANVLPALARAISALDYPRERLDAILLVEEDDVETRAAAERLALPWLRLLVVSVAEPRTKPRACNAGLEAARGEFVVVFDAEDRPEPDQLKQAVRVFRRLPPAVACLQARLNYYNAGHNLLTRCFALEYAAWFDLYLPGLHSLRGIIPLGGTSNHFRADALRHMHGWDPWNVTEDCELGVRLARSGLETRILDSTTWEEAVSQIGPWLRQRSRWVKGYWQTHLVHTRAPLDAVARLGAWRAAMMLLTVGGQVAVLLANPVCWVMAACWLWHPWPLHDPARPLTRALLVGTVALALFNVLFVAIHALAAVRRKRSDLLPACLCMPFYWLLVSLGAWRGVIQSFTAPFRWEKTPHGIDLAHSDSGAPVGHPADLPPHAPPTAVPVCVAEPVAPAARRRRRWSRWGSVTAVLLVLAGIALVASPLARWLMIVFGAVPLSGPNATDERVVEACWIGRSEAALTLTVTPGDWSTGRGLPLKSMPLAAVVHVKVGDGTYFETRNARLTSPLSGGPTNLTLVIPLGQGWRSPTPGAEWGPWCLRRVRAVGLRLYGADGPPQSVQLAAVVARGEAAPVPLAVSVRSGPTNAEVWRQWEAQFSLSREYPNPFDPDEIDVWGVFTSPTGGVVRVPAFYTCDYVRSGTGTVEQLALAGTPRWAVRFMPPTPGAWRWRIEAADRTGDCAATGDQTLVAAAATTPGPVRVAAGQPWFLRADGSFFYPVTLNIRSPADTYTDEPGWPLYSPHAPDPEGGARVIEGFLERMGASGITLGRVWLSPWFGGLEWSAAWNGYHGLGRYNLQNAWRVDRVLAAAEARGVTVELALQPHGPFTHEYDVQWQENPYRRINGGPIEAPSEILTDPDAIRWMRNRLRYTVARWGASPALFGWLLWIEMNTVSSDDDAIVAWHRQATEMMRRIDVGRHPITTEFQGPRFCMDVWRVPGIDYIQCPAYNFGDGMPETFEGVRDALGGVGKPLYIEEYGGNYQGGEPGWVAHEIHDGLWLGWVQPYAASPMAWWWNFIFARHLDRYYARFAEFVRGQDLRGRAWRYPEGTFTPLVWLRANARACEDVADIYLYGPATDVRFRGGGQSGQGWERGSRAWHRLAGAFDPLAADPGRLFDVAEGTRFDLAPLQLKDGDYRVEIWDTWLSGPPAVRQVTIRAGRGELPLPALKRDTAIRIRPKG